MSRSRVVLGNTGEDLACRELQRRGYAILDRRYRCRDGELDIVARDGTTLVFVEVKTRQDRSFGGGADAVTGLKRRRLTRAAQHYVSCHRIRECPCRFDVVAIDVGDGEPTIEVFQNAFDMCG